MSVWDKLRYFRPENTADNWGEPDRINEDLLLMLDDYRHFIKSPILITHGTDGEHTENSLHYSGRALDWLLIPKGNNILSLMDAYLALERFNFTGIGMYPHWKYYGMQIGGFHTDNRRFGIDPDGTFNYKSARWMGVTESINKGQTRGGVNKAKTIQHYVPLNVANLKKFQVIPK